MIDKLDLKIDWMDEERFDKIVQSKINEIISKVNSMEESISSHFRENFDDNMNYSNICCECNKEFKGHKREVVCKKCHEKDITEQPKEEGLKLKVKIDKVKKLKFESIEDDDGFIPKQPKAEKSLLEQANEKSRILINTSGDCNEIEEVVELFNQYAKEAEEKLEENEKAIKHLRQIRDIKSKEIWKLEQEIEQLKQNKVEIDEDIILELKRLKGNIYLNDKRYSFKFNDKMIERLLEQLTKAGVIK